MELLFIVIQILINIIIICTIINTKKVKAGNLAEENRHSAGRGGGSGRQRRGYGLTTRTSLTGTCYQQATKRVEPLQLPNRRYFVTGQSLAASENWSEVQADGRCCPAPGELRSPAWPLYCVYLHWMGEKDRGRRVGDTEQRTLQRCEGVGGLDRARRTLRRSWGG